MHIWTQNLNERRGMPEGSILWHGRGHISRRPWEGMTFGAEWLLFHKTGWRCGISFDVGHGDGNDGIMLVLKVPWLFALYLHVDGLYRFKEARTFSIDIGDNRIRFEPWGREMEWRRDDPWWIRGVSWDFPWTPTWVYTRILSHNQKQVVFEETSKQRRDIREQLEIAEAHSCPYPYHYVLKNGEVQNRIAKVHVEERAWGYKWWRRPFNVCRSIAVNFDAEVGEGTGSWKGGCFGCGYDLLPGESAEQCLRRMEKERRFER